MNETPKINFNYSPNKHPVSVEKKDKGKYLIRSPTFKDRIIKTVTQGC